LWAVKNDPAHRYRCYTGHVYTEKLLQDVQDLKIEESIWVSIRMLEEKRNMFQLLASRKSSNDDPTAFSLSKKIEDINEHIKRLKVLVVKLAEHKDDNSKSA
jgi:two-component system chemotaxis response regulator CheB